MNVNDNNGNSGQILGGILIMKNSENMMKIIDECINVLRTDHLLVTDHYNKMGQCSGFIDNRHDQSILSLVRKKRRFYCIKWMKHTFNHLEIKNQ